MNRYDYEKIDKEVGQKVDAIYADPARHKFVSAHDLDQDVDRRGPRGGKIRGRKAICGHCGQPSGGHADITEQI
jgi:hypothetical protein